MRLFFWNNDFKFFPLFSFFMLLFFAPLNASLLYHLIRSSLLWNELGYLVVIFIAFLCVHFLYSLSIKKSSQNILGSVPLYTLGFILLLFMSALLSPYSINYVGLLRYLILFCAPLFIYSVLSRYSFYFLQACLLGVLCLQAQWGIAQFIVQEDLGLPYAGESVLEVGSPGVATFSSFDSKLLRAYGPYQHPNVYAGSLSMGLISLLLSMTLQRRHLWNKNYANRMYVLVTASFVFLGLMLAYSRIALLGTLLAFTLYALSQKKMLRTFRCFLPLYLMGLLFVPLFYSRTTDVNDMALPDRSRGYTWSASLIGSNMITGPGNYKYSLDNFLEERSILHAPWEVDYVHSTFLLFIAELGLWTTFGSILLLSIFLWRCRDSNLFLIYLFVTCSLPMILFDHYILTSVSAMLYFFTGAYLLKVVPRI